jgi:hypothetical protein
MSQFDPKELEPGDVVTLEHFCDCGECPPDKTHVARVVILEAYESMVKPSISSDNNEGELSFVPYEYDYLKIDGNLIDHRGRKLNILAVEKAAATHMVGKYKAIILTALIFESEILIDGMVPDVLKIREIGYDSHHAGAVRTICNDTQLISSLSKVHAMANVVELDASEMQIMAIADCVEKLGIIHAMQLLSQGPLAVIAAIKTLRL